MKAKHGWNIKRCVNPCPDKWPGPWFTFSRSVYCGMQEGKAHFSTIAYYVSEAAMEDLKRRFNSIKNW